MTSENAPLPWQIEQWTRLREAREAGRLPHALLLQGPAGSGKLRFAKALAQSLLCQAPDPRGVACGTCRTCRLYLAGSHPDSSELEPEGAGKAIRVDSVRDLGEFLSKSAQLGGRKLVVIAPAEAMNRAAANSLLKTLEEPSGDTVMILVTSRVQALLPTIRSRCQKQDFPRPPRDYALQWLTAQGIAAANGAVALDMAQGGPLAALEMVDEAQITLRQACLADLEELRGAPNQAGGEPVRVAKRWLDAGTVRPLEWFCTWVSDMIRLRMNPEPPLLGNPDLAPRLRKLSKALELKDLFHFHDELREAARLAAGASLNQQLLLEARLIAWSCLRSASAAER